jgi:serine/threonine protein kinase/Tol biopolymer transport system component
MALMKGTCIGPYEVQGTLGEGGMGQVYRARDPRLGRDVALKILPEHFINDTDRVARFQREARVLASLNHPNIGIIYDLHKSDGVTALVLELVEGPTLAERIGQGPMQLDDALAVASQIAEALEAAHDQGIIHRDLKPANVKIRMDGTVKVLDFGLAKPADPSIPVGTLSESPTGTSPAMTQAGIILGTAAYMSPEQARGKATDRRSDVWAFGCVLYEMLTGTRAFAGDDVTDVLAALIRAEPDWKKLPSETPASIQKLLRRCLAKDRKKRLPDIGAARLDIQEALIEPGPDVTPSGVTRRRWLNGAAVAWIAATISLVAALGIAIYFWPPPKDTRVIRTSILPPDGMTFTSASPARRFALSPDGRRLAFVGSTNGRQQLWIRSMDSLETQILVGTDGAQAPFWSPDSKYVGFSAAGKTKTIAALGGPVTTLASADGSAGGSWGPGLILFRPSSARGLYQIGVAGGTPIPVTAVDPKISDVVEGGHWQPFFLPDGKHFLYHVTAGDGAVYVGSLDSAEKSRLVIQGGSNAQYASGHILFMRDSTLMAQPFNPDRLVLEGEAHPVAENVQIGGTTGRTGAFSVSASGLLVYQTGLAEAGYHVVWFTRDGKPTDNINQSGDNRIPRLSPDEKQLVVRRSSESGTELWVIDLARGTNTRLTFGSGSAPVWSPDGNRVLYQANGALFIKQANGATDEALFLKLDQGPIANVMDWSKDNKHVLFTLAGDIWVLPLYGDKKPQSLMTTRFTESQARFSPNSDWIAYTSNESSSNQIYVQPFPLTPDGRRVPLSVQGGTNPRWSGDGKELFFVGPDRYLVSVAVKIAGSTIDPGAEKRLFQLPRSDADFAVTADGNRFLFAVRGLNVNTTAPSDVPLTAVFNWTAGLRSESEK